MRAPRTSGSAALALASAAALLLVATTSTATSLHAQAAAPATKPATATAAAPAPAPMSAKATGARREIMQQMEDAERKYMALLGATSQEKLAFRPAPGVRSTGEVFMHMVGANYMLPGIAGVKTDPGVKLSRDMEKTVTDKAQIADMLGKSFAYAKQAMLDVPDAEMDVQVNMFGQQTAKRGVLMLMATHAHEHLGQSIAYARMNGVVPPWSATGP
jgi:uncharacterized damage-inducible protein DinB